VVTLGERVAVGQMALRADGRFHGRHCWWLRGICDENAPGQAAASPQTLIWAGAMSVGMPGPPYMCPRTLSMSILVTFTESLGALAANSKVELTIGA
jgi:hypothetical protein